jgi:hypothetical protein
MVDVAPVEYDLAKEIADPVIRALDTSAFGESDMVNMLLQRSEVLYDSPRGVRAVRSWMDGDEGPILSEVERLGDELPRRVAAVIHADFKAIESNLDELPTDRIADIGCGYAIFDLFAARKYGSEILLIDIEQNDGRHFGFEDEAAAYTSLDQAGAFLEANGIEKKKIVRLNPQKKDLSKAKPVDLAVSFASCGFHYPVDTYMDFFDKKVKPGGAVIVDLRRRTADRQAAKLATLGKLEVLPGHPKSRRVLVRKAAV